jgi:ribonuclease P protein component
VIGEAPMIERLKKRRDFLAAAKGQRTARRAFVLEALARSDTGEPRFGFTVSKRVAKKAVERNRIRRRLKGRRLKEAARISAEGNALAGHDYVLIGRTKALSEPFGELTVMLAEALRQTAGTPNSDTRHASRRTLR